GVVNVDGVQPGATYPSTVVLPILRAGVPCIDAGSDDGGSDSAGAGGAPGAGGGPGSGGVTTGSGGAGVGGVDGTGVGGQPSGSGGSGAGGLQTGSGGHIVGTGGAGTGGRGTGGGAAGTGGSGTGGAGSGGQPGGGGGPCAGLCDNPTVADSVPYHSGNLGTDAVCVQITASIQMVGCSNFAS